jgi:hypothetical protein
MQRKPLATPFEVVRNYFGELPSADTLESLSIRNIEALGNRVSESAQAASFDPVPEETYYPGGWLGSGRPWRT